MYINKPSATKIEAADRVNLLHSTISTGLNSGNHENLVKCLYPSLPRYPIVTKRLLLSDIQTKH